MLQTKQPFKISGHNYTSSDFQCETCKDMKKTGQRKHRRNIRQINMKKDC